MPKQVLGERSGRRAESPYAVSSLSALLARARSLTAGPLTPTVKARNLNDRIPRRSGVWGYKIELATFRSRPQACE